MNEDARVRFQHKETNIADDLNMTTHKGNSNLYYSY